MKIRKEIWRIKYKEGYFYLVKPQETLVHGRTITKRDIYELETSFRSIVLDEATKIFINGNRNLASKII